MGYTLEIAYNLFFRATYLLKSRKIAYNLLFCASHLLTGRKNRL